MTGTASGADLFRGVDGATLAAALVHRLRGEGVDVGPLAANRFSSALVACRPTDTDTLYWVARVTLVGDRRDLPVFERVFAAVFGGIGLPIAPRERDVGRAMVRTEGTVRHSTPVDGLAAVAARIPASVQAEIVTDDEPDNDDPDDDQLDDTAIPELLPADLAVEADRPFEQLDPDQLDRIGQWLADAVDDLPRRTTRRRQPSPRGSVDLRRSLARARSTGEVLTLARRRPRTEPRPLVLLADVSGSMERYARIHLHLLRAFAARPDLGAVEAFVFATELHRVTPALRQRDAAEVIEALSAEATDRFAGTRIAANLGTLLASPRWSHRVRGATVLILSDGWDSDDPTELGRRMARLRRMAYRVVWVNPRAGHDDWEPQVAAMAAALPHVDELCSGHSLRAVLDVLRVVAGR